MAGHFPVLDGVRGLAILLVLLHNFNLGGPIDTALTKVVDVGLEIGWVGVQLFFVLSGFLITGILVDTKAAPNYYSSFYGRRVLRIFPLYYLVLIMYFVVVPRVVDVPASVRPGQQHQVWLWTYLSNWNVPLGRDLPGFSHFWSLAVEEQFYLVWPLVVQALNAQALLRLCLGLTGAALVLRTGLGLAGADPGFNYQFTLCRMDGLAIGAVVALALRDPDLLRTLRPHLRRAGWALALVMLALVVATRGLPSLGFWTQTVGYTALALLCALLIGQAALATAAGRRMPIVTLLTARPLRTLGKYSYGIYVFQRPLHVWAVSALGPWLVPEAGLHRLPLLAAYLLAATAVTFAAALLSYHLVEEPFLRLKRLFTPQAPAGLPSLPTVSAAIPPPP